MLFYLARSIFAVSKANKMKTLATTLLVITAVLGLEAATCTFTGNGDGTSWSDGSNWIAEANRILHLMMLQYLPGLAWLMTQVT